MIKYAVLKVAGKQFVATPGVEFEVPLLEEEKELKIKPLMLVEDDKVKIGKPFVDQEVKLTVIGMVKTEKIRVAKHHPKANYRRATGYRGKATKVVLAA